MIVAKGQYNTVDMKRSAGDPIEGGLKAALFKNIDPEKGVYVHITLADDGVDKPDKGERPVRLRSRVSAR